MCSAVDSDILPEPPAELKQLSHTLAQRIRSRIEERGPIPFSEYMEMALYEPGLGYYSAGLLKFGQGGDFVTAPQLGDVFARCLARQVQQVGEALGSYEIVELGAGSGVLAADLLNSLNAQQAPERYRILERSAHLRQVQKETLEQRAPQWAGRVEWLDQPPQTPWQGMLLANEVLDALAVERFCIQGDRIRRLMVGIGKSGFEWRTGDCSESLERGIRYALSSQDIFPASDYRSEYNHGLAAWLQAVTSGLLKGVALFVDYGYTRREYYLPQRNDGTMICHYRHRAHDDPFTWPGLTDISASVDFTALAEAADHCGLEVTGYCSQAMFLFGCGLEDIFSSFQSLPEQARVLKNAEVRRLTLPGQMGERFQVMALTRDTGPQWGDAGCLIGFSMSDLRHRL